MLPDFKEGVEVGREGVGHRSEHVADAVEERLDGGHLFLDGEDEPVENGVQPLSYVLAEVAERVVEPDERGRVQAVYRVGKSGPIPEGFLEGVHAHLLRDASGLPRLLQ